MSDEKYIRGNNGETICCRDLVIDTRPDGRRGVVTGIAKDNFAMVRFGKDTSALIVAGRHLSRVP